MQGVAEADGGSILWWGIDVVNPVHSAPGLLETQGRGLPQSWWVVPKHAGLNAGCLLCILQRVWDVLNYALDPLLEVDGFFPGPP